MDFFRRLTAITGGFALADPNHDPILNNMQQGINEIPGVTTGTSDFVVRLVAGLVLSWIGKIIDDFIVARKEKRKLSKEKEAADAEIIRLREKVELEKQLSEIKMKIHEIPEKHQQ